MIPPNNVHTPRDCAFAKRQSTSKNSSSQMNLGVHNYSEPTLVLELATVFTEVCMRDTQGTVKRTVEPGLLLNSVEQR